jgi:hypothetical protein
MVSTKSLEYSEVFTTMLRDVQTLHSTVYTTAELKKDLKKISSRISYEGLSFLTKTLPRLGKSLDKALAGTEHVDAGRIGFRPMANSQIPILFGSLFRTVLSSDGAPLHDANVKCVESLRTLLFVFYKLETPCETKLELKVIQRFIKTEDEVKPYSDACDMLAVHLAQQHSINASAFVTHGSLPNIQKSLENMGLPVYEAKLVRIARRALFRVFSSFDHRAIWPSHGPGAVSTKEKLEGKYEWTNVSRRITQVYPLDEYFYASAGHICDHQQRLMSLPDGESLAKVVLVPKDSRGPRLISCEPLDFQWIQQGLSRAIVRHIEHHPLTRDAVRFTNQEPNRNAALAGSFAGKYATLDLNEASDRVSLGLVRLLFPEPVLTGLVACRSLGTRLPDGQELLLHKYAPMGSALCFPVLALTVWSLLYAGFKVLNADRDVISSIYVYGDDVIVPTAYAAHAMNILEYFGLKINRDKSCTKGFFRESCGMDAFKGVPVTPVRIRTVWSSLRCPESYVSWISYANSFWDRKYFHTYELIVERLFSLYGCIPSRQEVGLTAPALKEVPEQYVKPRRRTNKDLQKSEWHVWCDIPVTVHYMKDSLDGWSMLLRFFAEACSNYELSRYTSTREILVGLPSGRPFSVSVYTKRRCNKLQKRWR